MFKNMRLVILFDMLLSPSFQMTTTFTNIARTTANSLGTESLYEKNFLILNERKTSLMLKLSLQNSLQNFESLFLRWCERLPIAANLKS